jgi:hypothetical protein
MERKLVDRISNYPLACVCVCALYDIIDMNSIEVLTASSATAHNKLVTIHEIIVKILA